MDYGIKVTIEGKDVSSQSIDDFTLHSDYNMLKIYSEGHGTASVTHSTAFTPPDFLFTDNTYYVTQTHNFGYKPIFMFYIKHPASGRWSQAPSNLGGIVLGDWDLFAGYDYPDDNTARGYIYDGLITGMPVSPTNIEYKYYILIDPRREAWFSESGGGTSTGLISRANDYGIKVGRPGIHVTNPNIKDSDLVWSSDWNTFKIYKQLKLSAGGSAIHGLAYPPTFTFSTEVSAGKWTQGNPGYQSGGNSYVSVDSTTVYNNSAYDAYINLFIDPLNE